MVRKSKPIATRLRPSRKPSNRRRPASSLAKKLAQMYPSLAHSPTPAERRAELEQRLCQRGARPIEDFDHYLEDVSDFWPEDETCDEFLAWLRALRREERS